MTDDIVDRLRASVTAARAVDRSHLLAEAADEIERLRETCPHIRGKTTHYCDLNFTLTDAEREAIRLGIAECRSMPTATTRRAADTMQAMLDRLA